MTALGHSVLRLHHFMAASASTTATAQSSCCPGYAPDLAAGAVLADPDNECATLFWLLQGAMRSKKNAELSGSSHRWGSL
jgi:hypothetical protein